MSHNVEHYTYPKNVNKKLVQKDLDNYVAHADWQEGCTGLFHDIRWLDGKIYENYDEAVEAIEKLDRGSYDQLAVLYKESRIPTDNKIKELREKVEQTAEEYGKRSCVLYAQTVTSAFIGCKKCGSKLARTMLRTNQCPVCHSELRPDHMLKSVQAAKNKWLRSQSELNEYIQKKGKKDIMWLVKIEYHT